MHASNYRYKSSIYQTVKLDKESENVSMRRRTANMSSKGKGNTAITNTVTSTIPIEETKLQGSYNKTRTQTVWERLSKVKRVPSPHDIQCPRQRQHVNAFNHVQDIRKPLLPTGAANAKRYSHNSRSISPPMPKEAICSMGTRATRKTVMLPTLKSNIENQAFVYVCKPNIVKEIMTPRSLSDSKSSKSFSKSDEYQNITEHVQIETIQEDDNELPLSGRHCENDCDKLSTSRTIITNFRDILRRKNNSSPPPEEELNILKAVFKSDKRYSKLNKNDSTLFKDILKTQLKSIVHHETIVKNALNKLDCVDELVVSQLVQTESAYATPLGSARSSILYDEESKPEKQNKLEVDVIFKNVPSLEREITLLRTIGEKLNATLNNTLSPRNLSIEPVISTPTTCMPFQSSEIIESNCPVILQYVWHSAIEILEYNASVMVNTQYIALKVGVVREYRIAQKTIVELKEEDNKPFYIPTNTELKRTSFRKLKENPDILMRYIKPKNTSVSFNILDQDPIFFNNIFFNKNTTKPSINMDIPDNTGLTESSESVVLPYSIGDGDGCITLKDATTPLIMQQNEILQSMDKVQESVETSPTVKELVTMESQISGDGFISSNSKANCDKNHSNISVRVKRSRKRIRKNVTPMPLDYREHVEPKNHLLRTIFIGAVQISVFIFLIMTFTYPGPKC